MVASVEPPSACPAGEAVGQHVLRAKASRVAQTPIVTTMRSSDLTCRDSAAGPVSLQSFFTGQFYETITCDYVRDKSFFKGHLLVHQERESLAEGPCWRRHFVWRKELQR